MNDKAKAPRQRVSTLENVVLTDIRADGNTTRQIDKAVQIILSGDICVVRDHYQDGNYPKANHQLLLMIFQRLNLEHPRLIRDKQIRFDHVKHEIYLTKPIKKS